MKMSEPHAVSIDIYTRPWLSPKYGVCLDSRPYLSSLADNFIIQCDCHGCFQGKRPAAKVLRRPARCLQSMCLAVLVSWVGARSSLKHNSHIAPHRPYVALNVLGYSGSKHKSFRSFHEARDWLQQNDCSQFHFHQGPADGKSRAKAKCKWHAVHNGRNPGIYDNWGQVYVNYTSHT